MFPRPLAFVLLSGLGLVSAAPGPPQEAGRYVSPYRVEFKAPADELIGDLLRSERGDPRLQANVPHAEWYSRAIERKMGAWGPGQRHYPPFEGLTSWPAEALRERVLAAALRFEGYGYQHHHIPDWDPPASWPWKETCFGRNGKGVDCSNFTGFVYNQAFGLRLNTDVVKQSELREAIGPGPEGRTRLQRIELPADYQERIETLRTGDLLFIRSKKGTISHVVFWVGPIGQAPDGVPLVLDSHGADTKDSEGKLIPCGIHLRPFRKNSWYNGSASHALRVFRDDSR
jgi:hypothetical protein